MYHDRADQPRLRAGGRGARAPGRAFLVAAARVVLGGLFFVTGLNGFLNFLPAPPTIPEGALAFSIALAKTGYMMPLIMGAQTGVGALLLVNRWVPLALAIAAPLIVNILAFHAFLMPSTVAPGIVAAVLEVYLAWRYRAAYRPMLAGRADPT